MGNKYDRELGLDVGLANEIKLAARRAGATLEDLKLLATGTMLQSILPVLRGVAEVNTIAVDCDREPKCFYHQTVKTHKKCGKIPLEGGIRPYLYQFESQRKVDGLSGTEFLAELEKIPNLIIGNATLLDYYLEHQTVIPQSWIGKKIYFFGTTYDSTLVIGEADFNYLKAGGETVRCLSHNGACWGTSCNEKLLSDMFDDNCYAVVLY